jgi:hypothetical protein
MKRIINIILFATAFMLPFGSCNTDELKELNVNPNALNEIPMNFMFTAAQLGAATDGSSGDNWYNNWRTNLNYAAYYIQQLSGVLGTFPGGDKYFDNVESYSAPWEFIYGDQLKNLHEVLKQTGPGGFEEGRRANTREAARILRVFLFHRLTDYYGNIPYTEASKGTEGVLFPTYTPQSQIYPDLLKELSEASAAISSSNPDDGFAAADLYFDGDITKWKKWGYSLMLRLAMRASNVAPDLAETYVAEALANGVMTSNADNVVVPMSIGPSVWTNQNGLVRAFVDGGASRILSKALIDELKGPNAGSTTDDDPRLAVLTTSGATDPLGQHGHPNGLDNAGLTAYLAANPDLPGTWSIMNPGFLDYDEPYMLMNYAEVEFLQAEAALRGIGGATNPQQHYENGVRAAMQMYTIYDASFIVTDAQVDAYLAARPYNGTVEQIFTQMWISKFMNWWDAWADYRRTGFPVLQQINYPGNNSGGQIPRRLRLPLHEVALNFENYSAGATSPDNPETRVWWDGGN